MVDLRSERNGGWLEWVFCWEGEFDEEFPFLHSFGLSVLSRGEGDEVHGWWVAYLVWRAFWSFHVHFPVVHVFVD